MQPCSVCGGVGIDAGGYCTTCHTYRGVPSAPAPQGYSVIPPASGAPYPGSGAPYPGSGAPYNDPMSGGQYNDPMSGGPYGAPMGDPGYAPTSGAPYPSYGGGYPGGPAPGYPPQNQPPNFLAPPPQPRSRNSFVLPLVALSVVLVVLVVAIVAVAALRSGTKKVADGSSASASPSSKVDTCVVGTWNITSESQDVAVEGVGSVTFKGSGARVLLRANGTGEILYNGTTYTGTISGHQWDLIANGSIKYDYTTSNGSMAYSNFVPTGTVVIKLDGTEATSEPMTADEDPVRYTCTGDTMTQTTNQRTVSLTRVSKTA
jgi:hypothetical protein